MRAIQLENQQIQWTATHPLPTVPPGECLVEVLCAGICETDLQLARGYMGFRGILGHEFVGVARSGPWTGQRVVGEINCSCQRCEFCLQGASNHCPNRSVLGILNRDGAFADFLSLPERNLHLVPAAIPDWQAVFVEPLAAAFRIPQQISLAGIKDALVLGDGRLGNLCAQVLRLHGCAVTVVGKHQRKLSILENLGFAVCLLDHASRLERSPLVVDCTGSTSGLETALQRVRPQGTIVLKSTVAAQHSLLLAPAVIDEIQIVGSRCGPFPPAIAALERGDIALRPLVDAILPIDHGVSAFDIARNNDSLKVLIDVSGTHLDHLPR